MRPCWPRRTARRAGAPGTGRSPARCRRCRHRGTAWSASPRRPPGRRSSRSAAAQVLPQGVRGRGRGTGRRRCRRSARRSSSAAPAEPSMQPGVRVLAAADRLRYRVASPRRSATSSAACAAGVAQRLSPVRSARWSEVEPDAGQPAVTGRGRGLPVLARQIVEQVERLLPVPEVVQREGDPVQSVVEAESGDPAPACWPGSSSHRSCSGYRPAPVTDSAYSTPAAP